MGYFMDHNGIYVCSYSSQVNVNFCAVSIAARDLYERTDRYSRCSHIMQIELLLVFLAIKYLIKLNTNVLYAVNLHILIAC